MPEVKRKANKASPGASNISIFRRKLTRRVKVACHHSGGWISGERFHMLTIDAMGSERSQVLTAEEKNYISTGALIALCTDKLICCDERKITITDYGILRARRWYGYEDFEVNAKTGNLVADEVKGCIDNGKL
jgi:hypothetical protein